MRDSLDKSALLLFTKSHKLSVLFEEKQEAKKVTISEIHNIVRMNHNYDGISG
jgi:hypothetical protein